MNSEGEIREVGRLRHKVQQEVELLRRDALRLGTAAYRAAAKAGDEEDAARILGEMKALELLDPDAPPPVTAGVSPAELTVMREAAARLGAQPGRTGDLAGDDLFGALSGPFDPLPPDAWAGYQRHPSGHHFCVDGVLRAS